jgi:hypothetical protein
MIWFKCLVSFCILGLTFAQEKPEIENDLDAARDGKVFSLFSIVTFKNQACQTEEGTSGSGGVRNGTCYTTTECTDRSGSASGNCASGFGVCCFFAYDATATISENSTYIRNPGFPSSTTSATTLSMKIEKCSSEVCYLRLDFETFNLLGPVATDEADATNIACQDSFVVTTTSGVTTPTICGLNTGQHIYVDMGAASSDTATAKFTFLSTSTTGRTYEIKVTQIACSDINRPQAGCLQYHTGLTGRLSTFNFAETTTASQMHLGSQEYNICIRQEQGYCCVQYSVCADTNSFSLDQKSEAADTADIGTYCTNDFIEIGGGSATCNINSVGGYSNTRYCGRILSLALSGAINIPICDCTAPFSVYIKTDGLIDAATTAAAVPNNRGVCLEYTQIPCV